MLALLAAVMTAAVPECQAGYEAAWGRVRVEGGARVPNAVIQLESLDDFGATGRVDGSLETARISPSPDGAWRVDCVPRGAFVICLSGADLLQCGEGRTGAATDFAARRSKPGQRVRLTGHAAAWPVQLSVEWERFGGAAAFRRLAKTPAELVLPTLGDGAWLVSVVDAAGLGAHTTLQVVDGLAPTTSLALERRSITGRVVDVDGQPLRVTLNAVALSALRGVDLFACGNVAGFPGVDVQSGADGTFTFPPTDGNARWVVTTRGGRLAASAIVEPGSDARVELVARPTRALRVELPERALASLTVGADSAFVSRGGGIVTLSGVPLGKAVLRVWRVDGSAERREFELTDRTPPLRFEARAAGGAAVKPALAPSGSTTVLVERASSVRLAPGVVDAVEAVALGRAPNRKGRSGSAFDAVAPGTYTLVAWQRDDGLPGSFAWVRTLEVVEGTTRVPWSSLTEIRLNPW